MRAFWLLSCNLSSALHISLWEGVNRGLSQKTTRSLLEATHRLPEWIWVTGFVKEWSISTSPFSGMLKYSMAGFLEELYQLIVPRGDIISLKEMYKVELSPCSKYDRQQG